MTQREELHCDLLVVGAGMAGLTAAGRAAQAGLQVVVVEKAAAPGGSAALSGGYLWTLPTSRKLAYVDSGDPDLGAVVTDTYRELIDWVRDSGVEVRAPEPVLYGRGYQVDIHGLFAYCISLVEHAGGHLVVSTQTDSLLVEEGRVVGARTRHSDGEIDVRAPCTLLATGGLQGSETLRGEYIHPAAARIPLRSNVASTGDGLQLGLAAGAAHGGFNDGFYGHLVPCPVSFGSESDFVQLAMYHSDFSVVLNRAGRRFIDESRKDHAISQALVREPGASALLIWDEHVKRRHIDLPFVSGAIPLDKFELAVGNGGRGLRTDVLEDIVGFADELGFDGASCLQTLRDYNRACANAPETLQPSRAEDWLPLETPPYYILQVQPAITFAFSGLRIDGQARALDAHGRPVPGLLVAGADAGNVFRDGYGGGLAMAGAFGIRAAECAVGAARAAAGGA